MRVSRFQWNRHARSLFRGNITITFLSDNIHLMTVALDNL